MADRRTEELQQILYNLKSRKMSDRGITIDAFKQIISKERIPPEELINLGMADEIASHTEIKLRVVDDMKEHICSLPPGRYLGNSHFLRVNKLDYLLNNRARVI